MVCLKTLCIVSDYSKLFFTNFFNIYNKLFYIKFDLLKKPERDFSFTSPDLLRMLRGELSPR